MDATASAAVERISLGGAASKCDQHLLDLEPRTAAVHRRPSAEPAPSRRVSSLLATSVFLSSRPAICRASCGLDSVPISEMSEPTYVGVVGGLHRRQLLLSGCPTRAGSANMPAAAE